MHVTFAPAPITAENRQIRHIYTFQKRGTFGATHSNTWTQRRPGWLVSFQGTKSMKSATVDQPIVQDVATVSWGWTSAWRSSRSWIPAKDEVCLQGAGRRFAVREHRQHPGQCRGKESLSL